MSAFLWSCDFVNNPTDKSPENNNDSQNNGGVLRKVLVEDYTGHFCGQCPPAAEELHKIDSTYEGRIIGLAVHAGFFANPRPGYLADYRTVAGNAYNTTFGNEQAGNPNGLINRINYPTTTQVKYHSQWASIVAEQLNTSPKFQIKINNNYNTSSNSLSANITVKSLANNTGIYKLVVLLTEDSIISDQKDSRYTPDHITNYVFNHVLRGAINGEWGESIFETGAPLNDSTVKSLPPFIINSNYNAAKCNVIAFVYDADTGSPSYYEVLQVEEAHVK